MLSSRKIRVIKKKCVYDKRESFSLSRGQSPDFEYGAAQVNNEQWKGKKLSCLFNRWRK